jgi:hypothetical protein
VRQLLLLLLLLLMMSQAGTLAAAWYSVNGLPASLTKTHAQQRQCRVKVLPVGLSCKHVFTLLSLLLLLLLLQC